MTIALIAAAFLSGVSAGAAVSLAAARLGRGALDDAIADARDHPRRVDAIACRAPARHRRSPLSRSPRP